MANQINIEGTAKKVYGPPSTTLYDFPTITYVAGFLFSEDGLDVALVEKNRPKSMIGKLNGIGGKVEKFEFPAWAMVREFEEEAGVKTTTDMWRLFCTLEGVDYDQEQKFKIFFFCSYSDLVYRVSAQEDELIMVHNVNQVILLRKHAGFFPSMPNVPWLLAMAQSNRASWPYHIKQTDLP